MSQNTGRKRGKSGIGDRKEKRLRLGGGGNEEAETGFPNENEEGTTVIIIVAMEPRGAARRTLWIVTSMHGRVENE